jgi:hypothetical protein
MSLQILDFKSATVGESSDFEKHYKFVDTLHPPRDDKETWKTVPSFELLQVELPLVDSDALLNQDPSRMRSKWLRFLKEASSKEATTDDIPPVIQRAYKRLDMSIGTNGR